MIVFLTLLYCGLLAALVKLGIIKLTMFWKLSPIAWILVLTVALFIPMQWGAPAGPVNVYQNVIEIVPGVTGEVVEVPVEGLKPVKEGDVLFRIDPTQFRAAVDQLEAQLEDTKQGVLRLQAASDAAKSTVAKTESDVELFKSSQVGAAAAVTAAKAASEEIKGRKEKALAVVEDLKVQVAAAQREFDRIQSLLERNAASQSDADLAEIQITGLKSKLTSAEVDVRVADDSIARSEADVSAAEANANSVDLQLKQLIETELPRVRAKAREADLAANSMIGDVHTSVANVEAKLVAARFDLENTVVRAPADGYAIGVTLRPGQRVSSMPMRTWMSFVPTESTALGVGIPQYAMRHVQAGQKAEFTLKMHPGRVYSATVDGMASISAQGQLKPSGDVMAAPGSGQSAVPFGVRLKLDPDQGIETADLPGGSFGQAAIYTEKVKGAHLIRRVMLRMQAWMNYVNPW